MWYIYLIYDKSRRKCFVFKHIMIKLTITNHNIAGCSILRNLYMSLFILRLQRGLLRYEMYDTSILFSESVQNQINFCTWGCLDTETSYQSLIQRTQQSNIVVIVISLVSLLSRDPYVVNVPITQLRLKQIWSQLKIVQMVISSW